MGRNILFNITIVVLLAIVTKSWAAKPAPVIYSTNINSNSIWAAATWSPSYPGCCTFNSEDTLVINGKITLSQDLTISKGGLEVNDTLIVYGNLDIGNDGTLILNDNSVVILYGNVTIANKTDIAADSYFVILGDFTRPQGNDQHGSFTSNDIPSNVYIGGTVDVAPGWADGEGGVFDCTADSVHESSTCNYGNAVDLGNSDIADIVNSNCTDVPFYYDILRINRNPATEGGTLTITVNAGSNPSAITDYSWEGPNGYAYSDATTGTITRDPVTFDMAGEYRLTITNSSYCTLKDTLQIGVANCGPTDPPGYASKDNYTGNWEDESTWLSTPNSLPPPTDPFNSQVHAIYGYVTINGDMRVNGGSQYLCDTLVVTGNFYADNPTFEIGPNGLLIILGDYVGVSGTINNGARMIVAGEFTQPYDLSGGGTYYIFDETPTVPDWFGTTTYNESELSTMDPELYAFYTNVACGGGNSGGTIGTDQSICSGDNVAAFTSSVAAGPGSINYQWYESKTSNIAGSGTWTAISGATNVTYDHDTVNITTYFYRKASTGAGCSANSNVVTVNVTVAPGITDTTNISRCGTGTVDLGATASAGTINWYANLTGGSSLASGNTFTTPSISSTTTYYVDATNSGCTTASRTPVTATIKALPSITGTTDNERCGTGTVVLGATASAGTITWYDAATAGNTLTTGNSYTTPSISATTTYYVDATNNGCITASRTAVTATVNTSPTIDGVTYNDPTTCGGSEGSFVIAVTGGAGDYNIDINGGGDDYTNITLTSENLSITGLSDGAAISNLSINHVATGCSATNASTGSLSDPTPTTGALTISDADSMLCEGEVVSFTANNGSNYHFKIDNVTVQNSVTATYSNSGLSSGVYTMAVEVTDSKNCVSTYNTIDFEVSAIPSTDSLYRKPNK